jgi:uncharacterized membrane protein YhaH (DUF805 family)
MTLADAFVFAFCIWKIFSSIFLLIDQIIGTQIILYIFFNLLMSIPFIAVAVRRLHDVGKKGMMLFFLLVPVIGSLWLFYLYKPW